ncbi:MAG: hypothetical protein ABI729_03495 [Chitinophagales bacterium]
MEPTSKERILKNIRKGLIHATDQPFPNLETAAVDQGYLSRAQTRKDGGLTVTIGAI